MTLCKSIEMFPPIIRMVKLETLILSGCYRLYKIPEIQMKMDSLVTLKLDGTRIEVVPSSIGQCCIHLVSLHLNHCVKLKRIESNFNLLKCLKVLLLHGSFRLENPGEDFLDVECCLEELSLPSKVALLSFQSTSFNYPTNDIVVSMKLPNLPRFLTSLCLSDCNLGDGDIPSDICQLSNLQRLDLGSNRFTQLHSILSHISRLKYLSLSWCYNLVELPDLPSSIAVLVAMGCNSLEHVVDFPTNYRRLWKVIIDRGEKKRLIGAKKVMQSMLQRNAIEYDFLSLSFGYSDIRRRRLKKGKFRLKLPHNWYNDFSGFFLDVFGLQMLPMTIVMRQEMQIDDQPDILEELDSTVLEPFALSMCYISFGSVRHTSWWNETCNEVSFSLKNCMVATALNVELVPRISKANSMETAKPMTNCTEFWDDKPNGVNTFTITHESKSTLMVKWCNSKRFYF